MSNGVVIQCVDGCVVAPVPAALTEVVQENLRAKILGAMEDERPRAVIVDIGGVGVLDSMGFEFLRSLSHAVGLMGTQMVLTGIRAEHAAVLVQMDPDLGNIKTARTVDAALQMTR